MAPLHENPSDDDIALHGSDGWPLPTSPPFPGHRGAVIILDQDRSYLDLIRSKKNRARARLGLEKRTRVPGRREKYRPARAVPSRARARPEPEPGFLLHPESTSPLDPTVQVRDPSRHPVHSIVSKSPARRIISRTPPRTGTARGTPEDSRTLLADPRRFPRGGKETREYHL